MVTQKSKSTSWSPLVAAARSLTTTTMVGRIFLCYAALVSEALRRARRIGCTRTIGMGPLRMSQKKQGCARSEEHTSELQSPCNLVCRLLLEKKKKPRSTRRYLDTDVPVIPSCRKH